jgi:hypothetical protein
MHSMIGYASFVAWFGLYPAYRYWAATGKVVWLIGLAVVCAVGCTQDVGALP